MFVGAGTSAFVWVFFNYFGFLPHSQITRLLNLSSSRPPYVSTQVLCNLVYYRFMNPAIVAPDAFDVLEPSGVPGGLRPERRRLLGSAARLLQRAATGEPFLGSGEHVAALNRYVTHAHATFRSLRKLRGNTHLTCIFCILHKT